MLDLDPVAAVSAARHFDAATAHAAQTISSASRYMTLTGDAETDLDRALAGRLGEIRTLLDSVVPHGSARHGPIEPYVAAAVAELRAADLEHAAALRDSVT